MAPGPPFPYPPRAMEILIVRHAIAVPRGGDSLDHARPLTSKGRKRFEKGVKGLDALGVELDRVHHSPWVRAVQTAELLGPITRGERVSTERLAATPDQALLDELDNAGESDTIACVGHEPWMGELCALLLTGDIEGADFQLKKGAVAHLEGSPGPGGCQLLALYPPKVLRALA